MVTLRPSKQRKAQNNAPLHLRRKFLSAPLAEDVRKKVGTRSAPVRAGDKVKIMRGQFKGTTGKVDRTDTKSVRVYVTGVEVTKKNGAKSLYPLHPSNLLITEPVLSDKRRFAASQDSSNAKPAKK